MSIYVFKEEKNSGDGSSGIGPFVVVDFLIAWAIAYSIIHGGTDISINRSWNFTWFQSLILGFPVALLFVIIMFLPVIGLIIRSLFSLLDTGVVCTFIPFSRWVNGSLWWLIPIYCIFFFIFLLLHGITASDIMLIQKLWNLCLYILKTPIRIYGFLRRKTHASQGQKHTGSSAAFYPPERSGCLLDLLDYEKHKNGYSREIDVDGVLLEYSYDLFCIVSKVTGVLINVYAKKSYRYPINPSFPWEYTLELKKPRNFDNNTYFDRIDSRYDENGCEYYSDEIFLDRINDLEKKYGSQGWYRFCNEVSAQEYSRKRYAEAQQAEEMQRQRLENERRQREENQREQQAQQSHKTSGGSGAQNQDSLDEALFNGCNDKESLKQRYRQLMKTFHPDNQNGNAEMAQRIQNTYNRLAAKY